MWLHRTDGGHTDRQLDAHNSLTDTDDTRQSLHSLSDTIHTGDEVSEYISLSLSIQFLSFVFTVLAPLREKNIFEITRTHTHTRWQRIKEHQTI